MKSTNHSLKKKQKPNFILWSVIVVVLSVMMWLGFSYSVQKGSQWLAGTSWSILKKVEIIGNSRIPDHDILNVAAVPDSSNLMELPLDSISGRITEIPGVETARVIRRLPGRLVIKIREREAIAALAGEEIVLVDEHNEMFPLVHSGEIIDLPIITGYALKKDDAVRNGFESAIDLVKRISNEYPLLKENLGEVRFEGDELILRLRSGGASVRTEGSLSEEDLRAVDVFLQKRGEEIPAELAYLDLRFPAMVITGTKG